MRALLVLCVGVRLCASTASSCTNGAKTFLPCELTFSYQEGDLPAGVTAYRDDLLTVEFRSPEHSTILMHTFWDGGKDLRVRFSPTTAGAWTYHVVSEIRRFDNQEASFTVSDSGNAGMVNIANLRHWRTTNKEPHLWLAAEVPLSTIDPPILASWLDERKHDGFTHIRGTLLTGGAAAKPFDAKCEPNLSYFAALDERVLAIAERGFTLDFVLADRAFVQSGWFRDHDMRDSIVRYLAARYGGLNVTWEGIERFEETPDSRALLRDVGQSLKKYDGYHHPRSTDARDSASPLLEDGWMNFLIEAVPDLQFGAVEHQFTQEPEIHVVRATDPNAFRRELWGCTTNGEYPSISYESLQNSANVGAVRAWHEILSGTRHWELEPYFDVDGASAVGLTEVEYLAYAAKPGIVEITLPKHKYNPVWVNPVSGEESPLKDYKGEVFSRPTPDASHDWVLEVPREGLKQSMRKYYYFASQDPPVQEVEIDTGKIPFEIADPGGDEINARVPTPYQVKITRANRATRRMNYVWWGEVVASGQGARLLGVGPSGNVTVPKELVEAGADLNVRLLAINANGKAYELDRVYRLAK
ncbi:MAG: DUF5060 domain-containing protein [Acidobacteriaceae bacterium]|nr:DUF5060 domain-containing protein [Acidobacteriaceae bacterium]MBV8569343.1 DUF5060 domain-containing protein [Acidobacteriaceae bacterium]